MPSVLDVCVLCSPMEKTVHLGDISQYPPSQLPIDLDCELETDCADAPAPLPFPPSVSAGCARPGGQPSNGRPSSSPSQSQSAPPHKARGPNWTEAEMLVLIAQKRVEWDGRHNCNQPSLAKFVYGTTAWKLVLVGCMSVVGFRPRDTDQITNKWDGLIKDNKKLKDYIESSGSANWWGLNREEKKQLSKTRKMSLKFSESMYVGDGGVCGKETDIWSSN